MLGQVVMDVSIVKVLLDLSDLALRIEPDQIDKLEVERLIYFLVV